MEYVILHTECESRYVHAVHGTIYVSWVEEKDIDHAQFFPKKHSQKWIELIEDMTGVKTFAADVDEP